MSRTLVFCAAVALAGCASTPPPTSPPSRYVEQGLASWYGEPYHGRRAASGEFYDMHAMTAAHRTLPFGTAVSVTNLENGRSVEVVINDRGPFVPGRILDLSRAAAAKLGMLQRGVVPVRLVVLRWGDGMVQVRCWEVQVGAFAQQQNVARATAKLASRGFTWRTAPAGGGLTRVRVTGLLGLQQARQLARKLQPDFPGAVPVPCPESAGGNP